jgi:CHAD domain-containing protein
MSAKTLSEDSPPEHFHDLRKKGKRLRYALEPLQEIYGKPAQKMVNLLKKIQDDLGDHAAPQFYVQTRQNGEPTSGLEPLT